MGCCLASSSPADSEHAAIALAEHSAPRQREQREQRERREQWEQQQREQHARRAGAAAKKRKGKGRGAKKVKIIMRKKKTKDSTRTKMKRHVGGGGAGGGARGEADGEVGGEGGTNIKYKSALNPARQSVLERVEVDPAVGKAAHQLLRERPHAPSSTTPRAQLATPRNQRATPTTSSSLPKETKTAAIARASPINTRRGAKSLSKSSPQANNHEQARQQIDNARKHQPSSPIGLKQNRDSTKKTQQRPRKKKSAPPSTQQTTQGPASPSSAAAKNSKGAAKIQEQAEPRIDAAPTAAKIRANTSKTLTSTTLASGNENGNGISKGAIIKNSNSAGSAAGRPSSEEERKKLYFSQMKQTKKEEAEAKRDAEKAKLAAMDEDARAAYLQAQADTVEHERQQAKMLQKQMKAFAGGAAAIKKTKSGKKKKKKKGRGRGRAGRKAN
jgi:hypothetical protein